MQVTSPARQIYLSKRTRRAGGRRFRVGQLPDSCNAKRKENDLPHVPGGLGQSIKIAPPVLADATTTAILSVDPFPYSPDRDLVTAKPRNQVAHRLGLATKSSSKSTPLSDTGRSSPTAEDPSVGPRHGKFSILFLGDLRRRRKSVSTSISPERRKSRKSSPWYSQVSATLKSVKYSSTPFLEDDPAITSRSLANALTACSALLLFHGTSSYRKNVKSLSRFFWKR